MIRGNYDLARGAVITSRVYFAPPLDELLDIQFLLDSGASHTCISLTDLLRLSSEAPQRIAIKHGDAIWGIGGTTPGLASAVTIAFAHVDGGTSTFSVDATLLMAPSNLGLPSLLGRDVLFKGQLLLDPGSGTVSFDPPKDAFVL